MFEMNENFEMKRMKKKLKEVKMKERAHESIHL